MNAESRLWALGLYFTLIFTLALNTQPLSILILMPVFVILMWISEDLG